MRIRHLRTEKKREEFLLSLEYISGTVAGGHLVRARNSYKSWTINKRGQVFFSPTGLWNDGERVRGIEAKLVKMAAFPHYLEDER